MKKDKNAKKPLTLEVLAEYNQEVFLPALDAHFATKTELKEFKNEFKELDNAKQYVDKARNFFEEKSDDILEYSRKNGELIKYNKITKEFGAFLEDGTPKTLFKPENGIEYWYKQIINW